MKVSSSELREVIKLVVREELKSVLPGLLSEVLAARYLKQLAETVGARPPTSARRTEPVRRPISLSELMQGDAEADDPGAWEEEVPRAMDNDHEGIYHQSPLVRGKGGQATNESRRRALSLVYGEEPEAALRDERNEAVLKVAGGNPNMAALFEGTAPAPQGEAAMGETQRQFGEEGVPLDFLGKLGVNFDRVKQNVSGNAPSAAQERIDEDRLRALEKRRAMLDRR